MYHSNKNNCDNYIFLLHLFVVLRIQFNLFITRNQFTCLENIVNKKKDLKKKKGRKKENKIIIN